MSASLVELLAEAPRRFQRLAPTAAAGRATLRWSDQLEPALTDPVEDDKKPQVLELVLRLAAALCDLAPAARAALSSLRSTHDLDAFLGAAFQLAAGCSILFYCNGLTQRLDLSDKDAFRLATAAQLALTAGPLPLQQLKLAAERAARVQAAEAAAGQLSQAAALEVEQAMRAAMEKVAPALLPQLFAVGSVIGSLLSAERRPQAAAAFAGSTARPAVLLPWLRSVSEVLSVVKQPDDPEEGGALEQALLDFTQCMLWIVCAPCWAKHGDAIAADPALQAAVADVLLTRCLPVLARPDWSCGQAATVARQVHEVLTASSMQPGVQRLLRQPGASERVAAALGSLLALLPAEPPAEPDIDDVRMYSNTAQLAAMLVMVCTAEDDSSTADANSAADGSSSSSSSGGAAGGDMPAAWQRQLLPALPKLLQLLLCYAAAPKPRAGWPDGNAGLDMELALLSSSLAMLVQLQDRDHTPVDLYPCWVEAGVAAVRLQPQLARLDAALQQLSQDMRPAVHMLSQVLLASLVYAAPASITRTDQPPVRAAAVAALPQLLQLHSLACRLCHWLAGGATLAGWPRLDMKNWHWLQHGNDSVFLCAFNALQHTRTGPLSECPEARALCVAHLAAVQAATAAAAAAPLAPGYQGRTHPSLFAVVLTLQKVAGTCPGIVTSTFLQPAHAALAPLAQDASKLGDLVSLLASLAGHCGGAPRLACSLVSTGLLGMALDCVGRLDERAGGLDTREVIALVNGCNLCLENVAAVGALIGSDAPADLAQRAAAATRSLQEQYAALAYSASTISPFDGYARRLRQLLPAAEQVAAAFDAYCQLPSQQAAVRLEVARAAAGRSCAYLRCRNVEGEGGAMAGEGAGSMRCSGCRAVWYCGTACSHADWREGGHRRVCKLLGEERQRRKAAQRAA